MMAWISRIKNEAGNISMTRGSSVYRLSSCAEEYDADRYGRAFGGYLHDREIQIYASMIEDQPGSVLDAGAGTGKLSLALAPSSRPVVSVDNSPAMLGIAVQKAKEQELPLRAAVCDVHQLCFRNDAFDAVLCSRVLMHLADWRSGLGELCRVSRSVVVVDFPPMVSFASLDTLLKRLRRLFGAQTPPYRVFTVGSIRSEFRQNHLHVVRIEKGFFLPVALHRLLDNPGVSVRLEKACAALGLRFLFGGPVVIKAAKGGGPHAWRGRDGTPC